MLHRSLSHIICSIKTSLLLNDLRFYYSVEAIVKTIITWLALKPDAFYMQVSCTLITFKIVEIEMTSEVLRTRKMTAKELSAVHCIPLEEPKKMLSRRISVYICVVVEIKGEAKRHGYFITSLVIIVSYCDRTGMLQLMS
jgi:hypothetical protein